MKGIELPPEEEDFTADPVELFFDLAFVFAFSRLVYHLVHQPDAEGFWHFAVVITLIWVGWSQFTWSANAVAGNQRPVRALFLVGTAASIPMAASVTTAFDDGGLMFALGLAIILSLGLFTMIFGLPSGHPARAAVARYSVPNFIAAVILVAGGLVDGTARWVLWIGAIVALLAAMLLAAEGAWIVRPGHFAERHGLIIIVALGEVIVAMGVPLTSALQDGEGVPGDTMAVIIAAAIFACLLWWAYFDRVQRALEHRHHELEAQASVVFARDVFTLAHLPIVAGVILAAAGLEEIALHPSDDLPAAFRWMLAGGIALFFGGIAVAVFRAYRRSATERLAAGLLIAAVVALAGGSMSGLTLLIIVNALVVLALVFEHVRIEIRPSTASQS